MLLGKITIDTLRLRFIDAQTLLVPFTSGNTWMRHQLYIGRRMVAETQRPEDRELKAVYGGSYYPEEITVAAVEESEIGQDWGARLHPIPANVVRLVFSNAGWTGDPHEIDIQAFQMFGGEGPGEEIDYDTPLASLPETALGTHTIQSFPLGPSGEWNIGVRGIDTRDSGGNPGTEVETVVEILAYPPDFQADPPFTATITGGLLNLSAVIPPDRP